jgi:hypothetical protein
MAEIEVTFTGGPALLAKLKAMSGFLSSPQFRALLEDAGQSYVNYAKADCPISKNPGATGLVNGGALRGSIRYAVNNFGTDGVNVTINAGGANAPYAPAVEFGATSSMRVAVNRQVMFWVEDGAGRKVQNPWSTGAFAPGVMQAKGWNAKYRHIVWHPGTRPQPFFFKQVPRVINKFFAALKASINQAWDQR